MQKDFDIESFEKEIASSNVPVIVDFFASWCGPCKMLAPVLEKIQEKFEGSLEVIKIDIDKCSDLANKYNVMSVPTLMFFSGGELVRSEVGFMSEEKISQIIESDFCVTGAK
jgi:thioredoxin 1